MTATDSVDLDRLTPWLDASGVGSGPITGVTPLSGGTQNIMVRFTRAGTDYVLRRPPLHKRANSDETMRREARVLTALAGSDVPHPRLVAACDDLDLIGASFFVMAAVDGFTATMEVPDAYAASPEMQHRMGLSMVEAAAALSRVDPLSLGQEQYERAATWVDRQVGRWKKQLDSYGDLDGWNGPQLTGVDEIGDWLDSHRPRQWRRGIIHGDFHFGNVMFHRNRAELAAVVDWELATVGDPLLDLGHTLTTWPGTGRSHAADLARPLAGLPGRTELIERYGQASGRDMSEFDWYQVLACYRLSVLLEGTHARACAGKADAELGKRFHVMAQSLLDQAVEIISN